jgi:hypothetical protein
MSLSSHKSAPIFFIKSAQLLRSKLLQQTSYPTSIFDFEPTELTSFFDYLTKPISIKPVAESKLYG